MRGVLSSSTAMALNKALAFAMTLVLARLLSPRDFGVVAAGTAVIAFLQVAMDMGLSSAVIYDQERGVTHRVRTALSLNLVVGTVLALAGIAAAPLLVRAFHIEGELLLVQVLFTWLALRSAGQIQDAVLQRDMRFAARSAVDVARNVVRTGVSVVLAVQGQGPWSLVWGLLAGEAVALVAYATVVRALPAVRLRRSVVRSLMAFGTPVLTLRFANATSGNADNLVVANRLDASALGAYSIAFRLPDLVLSETYTLVSRVAYSMFSRSREEGAEVVAGRMLRTLHLMTLFGFPASVGLAVLAPIAVPVLYGDKWAAAVVPLVLLSLAAGASSTGYASGDVFPAMGRPATLVRLTVVSVAVLVILWWLVAPYGTVWVAAGHLAFHVIEGAIRLQLVTRLLQISWAQMGSAMTSGLLASVGVVALALPTQLLLAQPDLLGLVGVVAAGVTGALLTLLACDRRALTNLRDLVLGGRS